MNSTGTRHGSRRLTGVRLVGVWFCVLSLAMLGSVRTEAAEDPMPRPPQLDRDVQFWIRVYTQIDTNAGFLHDQSNLGVVYETLHFAPDSPPSERQRLVDQARERYAAACWRTDRGKGSGLLALLRYSMVMKTISRSPIFSRSPEQVMRQ